MKGLLYKQLRHVQQGMMVFLSGLLQVDVGSFKGRTLVARGAQLGKANKVSWLDSFRVEDLHD